MIIYDIWIGIQQNISSLLAFTLFLLGYAWVAKVDHVDDVLAAHINLLQTEKLDRDGAIPATGGPYIDVRAYASLALAIDGIGATETTLLIADSQNVVANKTAPNNIQIWFLWPGCLNIADGVTFTFNRRPEAGHFQIFKLTGTGNVDFHADANIDIYPEWW